MYVEIEHRFSGYPDPSQGFDRRIDRLTGVSFYSDPSFLARVEEVGSQETKSDPTESRKEVSDAVRM